MSPKSNTPATSDSFSSAWPCPAIPDTATGANSERVPTPFKWHNLTAVCSGHLPPFEASPFHPKVRLPGPAPCLEMGSQECREVYILKVTKISSNWPLGDGSWLIKTFSFTPSLDSQPILRCSHTNGPLEDAPRNGAINNNGRLLKNARMYCSPPSLPHSLYPHPCSSGKYQQGSFCLKLYFLEHPG